MPLDAAHRDLVDEIVRSARRRLGPRLRALALYGSVARGTARADSDVDVLLVLDDAPRSIDERIREGLELAWEAEAASPPRALGRAPIVSVKILSPRELWPTPVLLLDLADAALLLHDDGILGRKLDELRARMRELGSQRRFLPDGSWYWLLKPDARPGEAVEL